MERTVYEKMYQVEDQHFYYRSLRHLIFDTIHTIWLTNKKLKILDAGCGTGLTASLLHQFGQVQAIDINKDAVIKARLRGVEAKRCSILKLPFPANSFDIVLCVDVLYHAQVKSDQTALIEIFRVLKPNGTCIIRVPAIKWLSSSYDQLVHTRQRYNKNELSFKLTKAGFKVMKLSYIHAVLFPPAVLLKIKERLSPPKKSMIHIQLLAKPLNSLLLWLCLIEIKIFKKINLPLGIGLIAIAKVAK